MLFRSMRSFCKASTVGLHSLDANNVPTGHASGCIVVVNKKRVVLTANHVFKSAQRWAIKAEITESLLQKYYIPNFLHAVKGAINLAAMETKESDPTKLFKAPEEIDLSCSTIPNDFTIFSYDYDPSSNTLNGFPINEIQSTLEETPTIDGLYFFWGETRQAIDYSIKRIKFTEKFISGMHYKSLSGDYYLFEIDEVISDREEFSGTSGAPIFDADRKLVSIVCGGIEGTNLVFGINLRQYKILIDIESGSIADQKERT